MQINKIKKDMTEILSNVFDGATIMVGGFGEAGSPIELLHGLIITMGGKFQDEYKHGILKLNNTNIKNTRLGISFRQFIV